MLQRNPYFLTGTLGMLITAMGNILLENFSSPINSVSILYPVFIIFLLIGAINMVRRKRILHH